MTLAIYNYSENLSSLQLTAEESAPKLPFDINDYLNFELNTDFISVNPDFVNGYDNREERIQKNVSVVEDDNKDDDAMTDEEVLLTDPIIVEHLIQINENIQSYAEADKSHEICYGSNCETCYNEMISNDDTYIYGSANFNDYSFTPSSAFQHDLLSDVDQDEETALILRNKAKREASIDNSTSRRYSQDSYISDEDLFDSKINPQTPDTLPRSFECQKLMNRYSLLREWNIQKVPEEHHSKERKPSLIAPMMAYENTQKLTEENFARVLTSKLNMIEEDPEGRLRELEGRIQVHTYAMLQVYIERGFNMHS